jgi:hypothetical protein
MPSRRYERALMIDWNIQTRARACQACHRSFADKEPYYTVLFDHKHGLERLDVCEACWSAQHSQGATDRRGFISFWQGVFNVPPPAPPEPIQKENAESLLRKLVEENHPATAPSRYILAAMLERKRLFKVKAQTVQDGQRVTIYEHPKTGDVFTIPDLDLHLRQLEAVQRQVSELLQHGFNPPAPAPETPVAPADAASEESAAAKDAAESASSEPTSPTPAAIAAAEPSPANLSPT